MNKRLFTLAANLADAAGRQASARALAEELGAQNLLIFVPDPEIGTLLPAPGFIQTLPGRRQWREFLNRSIQQGYSTSALSFPISDSPGCAYGYAGEDGSVLVLLGGSPSPENTEHIRLLLPLVSAACAAERVAHIAEAQSSIAREAVTQANQLAASLDVARRDLQRAYTHAEEVRLLLSTTLRSIGDAVIATDAKGGISFINNVACELTGWTEEEALGKLLDDVFVIINEQTRLMVESPVAKVIREKRVVGLSNHTILIARDGTERPIDDSASPIRGVDGEMLGVVLVFRDFSESRLAEQAIREHQNDIEALNRRLQRAMTETHHRVKNNLQVISALIDLQVGSGLDQIPTTELVRMAHHIRGLAMIHDLLTQQTRENGESESLSVRVALDNLLPLLQGISHGRALKFRVEDARLPIGQATSFAVLTNELVSNATKHGRGDIGLSFVVIEKQGRLEVWDDGPGFPDGFDPKTSANTGIELVESLARWDLRGDVEYRNRPEGGASVLVKFPLTLDLPASQV